MDPIERSGQSTEVLHKMKITDEKVQELYAALAAWKMDVEVEVLPDGGELGIKVTCTKPNNTGFFYVVTAKDIDYFSNDPGGLISALTDKAIESLYKTQIKNAIAEPITKALNNIKMLRSKRV